uniref:Uncharacterized protein n=1 Tax=Magallana gigas TaxID=29159 RepID=K1PT89_MAGGI
MRVQRILSESTVNRQVELRGNTVTRHTRSQERLGRSQDAVTSPQPSVAFANNALYSSAIVVEREDITGSQANDKRRKVVNVLPYACSEKGAGYRFVNRKPRVEQPTTEDVCSHLREQEKHDNENDDNYDHACAASYLGTEPSVYSNMP